MHLQDFVDGLSIEALEQLRIAVEQREQKIKKDIDRATKYLHSQPALMKGAQVNTEACINVMCQKAQSISREVITKVVKDYLVNPDLHGPLVIGDVPIPIPKPPK